MRFLFSLLFLLIGEYYAVQLLLHFIKGSTTGFKAFGISTYAIFTLIQLSFLFVFLMGWQSDISKSIITIWGALTFIIFISKFIGGVFLFADDLRRMFLFIGSKIGIEHQYSSSRSDFLSKTALIIGAIPLVSMTYGMIRNPYNYKVFKQKFKVPNLPKSLQGLKIVQISDIHSGSFIFKEPVKRAVELINKENADIVCFTGDLVNNKATEMDNFIDVFDKIKSKHGIFSVLGNHDYGLYERWPSKEAEVANMENLKGIQKDMGWDLLLNENRLLDFEGHQLAIIGVENQSSSPRFPQKGDLNKAYKGTETAAFKLLLSHDPSHWEQEVVKDFKDINLTLSGHTHGMQFGIEIPGWIKWSPIKYVYKQWAGLYEQNGQAIYVNRGLGYLGYPGRVGIMPEITVIELQNIS